MKRAIIGVLVISLGLLIKSCDTTDPPDNKSLTLKLEDVSCTEAWLTLTANNLQLPATLNLLKDNNITKTINLQTADTLLYIDSLRPNQTYNFKLSGIGNPVSGINSNELSVTTLDTTSHNFTFETWTFGEHSNSVLFDVAIINENSIWAVGAIYMNDSLGQHDPKAYNALHWNGTSWELKRISVIHNGNLITPTLYGIYAFAATDIWISSGVPIHGDGSNWIQYHLFDMGILNENDGYLTKTWGTSSSDIYFVGTLGTIAHYNGQNWKRIESGTDVNLYDVWAQPDGNTIWTCGYSNDYLTTVLLKGGSVGFIKLYEGSSNNQNNGLYIGPLSGGWTNSRVYTCLLNWGMLYSQDNKEQLDLRQVSPAFYDVGFSIDGNNKNDIIVSGQDGMMGHFNGVMFKEYDELKINDDNYYSVAIKGNLAVAVGFKYQGGIYGPALISIGRR